MVEDPPYLKERSLTSGPIDGVGLGLIAIGVGCLEYVFDRGQEKDWFGDPSITAFAIVAVVLLVIFVFWEWNHEDPVVDLKLLRIRNFGTAIFLQFILGMVLFGTTVLIPQFLQILLGYTAERSGMVLSPAGFFMMLTMFIAGRVIGRMDPRLLVTLGYLITAVGLFNLTRLDLDVSFGQVTLWRVYQVAGLAFIFIPISTLNYIGVPREKNNHISSFSNFARNLGGSLGTALLTTFLARSSQVYQQGLASHVRPGSGVYNNYLAQTQAGLMRLGQGASTAAQLAYGRAYQQMLRQASMLSYKNAFFILSMTILCLAPLPFLMKRPPRARKPAPDAGHRAGGQSRTRADHDEQLQTETDADSVLTEVV
jgi:MFS transporter, DHA2 family, multidrug resistance protein